MTKNFILILCCLFLASCTISSTRWHETEYQTKSGIPVVIKTTTTLKFGFGVDKEEKSEFVDIYTEKFYEQGD